jgi:hypothetical protein
LQKRKPSLNIVSILPNTIRERDFNIYLYRFKLEQIICTQALLIRYFITNQ